MAIQFTDFSRAPLLDSPYANLLENVLKGYKMGQEPAKMAEEQKLRQLNTQAKQLEVEHKPKEYELNDKQQALINAMKQKALDTYDERFALDKQVKQAQIQKALRAPSSQAKYNGIMQNFVSSHPNASPQEIQDFADNLLKAQIEHLKESTKRTNVLNETQPSRGLSGITKKYDELRQIQNGKFPGTDDQLTPEQQANMQSSIMLGLVKETTDPKTREKLINANNMNITLDSIDPKKLTYYSGIEGTFVDKPADAILEGFGVGSQQYKDYIAEVNKANFAAKQMRQYLGDSIQPSAQAKLDKLTKPEAWNVSPETAQKNFEFMRELYKQESQTLVRAATDPTLYQSIGVKNNPVKNSAFTVEAPKIPSTVKNKEDFKEWLKTLSPAQRDALKAKHAGGQ